MMKSFSLLMLLVLVSVQVCGQNRQCQSAKRFIAVAGGSQLDDPGNLRSDTIDVIGFDISLDMTAMNSYQIKGACKVDFISLMNNVNGINLDLASLMVDSVTTISASLVFTHIGEILHVALPSMLNIGDAQSITVHYHGGPAQDATWGGFYFQSNYAFNLGVAFTSEPHNFGRAWFPCFDNFVERSTYTFHVLTNQSRKAYCNGVRTGVDVVGQDSLLTHWQLLEPIPSYLASVSVSTYSEALSSFPSISGETIPIWMVAKSADTSNMKQSMVNLPQWMQSAETRYGLHRWPRVGYCAVPFSGGAMEHATNISYPLFACDGSLAYETLYAHEVAHHWWGDQVTCRNAAEMWINEGWASYSEALFKEEIYGQDAYRKYVRDNHKDVLLYAHRRDGGRYPVSGVPSEITYGDHVYNKGADVVHTLRGYMGVENFFDAAKAFLDEYQFSDVGSENLRDFFQTYTNENLTEFFANWIFESGFPEFRVRDFSQINSTQWQVNVEQHSHYAASDYMNVPMQLTAVDAGGERVNVVVHLSGGTNEVMMDLPSSFVPVTFFLNEDEGISQAVLAENKTIYNTGNNNFTFAEMSFNMLDMGSADSVFVRVENHLAAADENQSQVEYYISPDRWWRVYHDGVAQNVDFKTSILYYGNQTQTNYFDPLFFQYVANQGLNEDSLIVVYRPDGASPWQVWSDFTVVTFPGLTNWTGRIDINHVLPGDYAWAVRTGLVSIEESELDAVSITQTSNMLLFNSDNSSGELIIFDAKGRIVMSTRIQGAMKISTEEWASGIYVIRWQEENSKNIVTKKIGL